VKFPFLNTARHRTTNSLLLALVYILLLFTGLGVFRLYFDFDWNPQSDGGDLFSVKIRGGKSFDLFASDGLGPTFWLTQGSILLLAVLMPLFRPIGAALLALATGIGIFMLHMRSGEAATAVPIEFEYLMVLVLLCLYTLLAFHAELRDRRRFTTLMSQYVPPELAAQYSRNPKHLGLEGEQREVSVLFCDVVGFSALSEDMDPPTLARWLNSYFSHVSKIVVRHAGTIDKYIGDSVMAFWGAPVLSDTHAHDALSAALDIQAELVELNRQYREQGLPEIRIAIGVSSGLANAGNLGSEYRMAYTVVGDTVNVAQRVEEQTRLYGVPIAVAGETVAGLPDMLFRELDTVNIRGRSKPVRMFQPLGKHSAIDSDLQHLASQHQKAIRASKAGRWQEAADLFVQLRDEWGPEDMYNLYLRGIEQASGGSVKFQPRAVASSGDGAGKSVGAGSSMRLAKDSVESSSTASSRAEPLKRQSAISSSGATSSQVPNSSQSGSAAQGSTGGRASEGGDTGRRQSVG